MTTFRFATAAFDEDAFVVSIQADIAITTALIAIIDLK